MENSSISRQSATHPDLFGVRRAVRLAASNRGLSAGHAERASIIHLARHGDRTAAILAGLDVLRTLDAGAIA